MLHPSKEFSHQEQVVERKRVDHHQSHDVTPFVYAVEQVGQSFEHLGPAGIHQFDHIDKLLELPMQPVDGGSDTP
jgi:hypothetical protein